MVNWRAERDFKKEIMNDNDLIDELEFDLEQERLAFSEPYEIRHSKALEMQLSELIPNCSIGVDDSLTQGYGILDFNGFWQYPL